MNKDLTVGKPAKVLRDYCIPLFASVIFQQLYNIADSFVAGKFVGENALAAVGNSYEITLIFIAVAFGCNIGCSVIVAQLFGAKKYSEMKTAVYTTMISCAVLCVLLMVSGLVLCENLLKLINTPKNIMKSSMLYLDIYIYGLPFVFFYNVATGIFSALGDSKTPFIFLAFSSTANIAADILFVTAFDMGVAGVAWATFICQGVSCVLSVIFVFKRLRTIHDNNKPKIFSFELLGKISAIAIPSMLQQSFVSVGNIIIQSVINTFGTGVIAGYSAAVKMNNLVVTSFVTFGNGISNFTAQNLGAQKTERVKDGFKAGLKIIWALCVPFVLIYFILGKYFIYMFLDNPTTTALNTGIQFLRIVSPFYFVIAVKLASDGIMRGAGKMAMFMSSTFTDLILRVILTFVLSSAFESMGIWMSWPIGWTASTIMSLIFYKKLVKSYA